MDDLESFVNTIHITIKSLEMLAETLRDKLDGKWELADNDDREEGYAIAHNLKLCVDDLKSLREDANRKIALFYETKI